MKTTLYKITALFLFCLAFSGFAQKQSKTFTETFNVKKDVEVEINASNAVIDVTTWNKNQVFIETIIEIEGMSKEKAEEYLKDFNFEAMGNSSKVRIVSRGNNSFHFDNDFVIFGNDFRLPDIEIPDFDFDFVMPNISIPNFNFDFKIPEVDIPDFDFDKYYEDGNYYIQWKDSVRNITIKSKKDWEKFKKSEHYKEWKTEMKKNAKKMKEDLKKLSKGVEINIDGELISNAISIAMESLKEIDTEEIREELKKANKEIKEAFKSKNKWRYSKEDKILDGKKVKIKKTIKIKVPKGATFNLNTRHSKIKLPDTKATGKVSYGSFDAVALKGGNLKIYSSAVDVNRLENADLSLNNVTDASFASVANSKLESSTSDVKIKEVISDFTMDSSFGDVSISRLNPSLKKFKLMLRQSDATLNIKGFESLLKVTSSKDTYSKKTSGSGYSIKGEFVMSSQNDLLKIDGKYSELTIQK